MGLDSTQINIIPDLEFMFELSFSLTGNRKITIVYAFFIVSLNGSCHHLQATTQRS